MIRSPSPSIFRPKQTIDRSVLAENRALIAKIDRRGVLRGTLSLGALSLLSGCTVTDTPSMQTFLRGVSSWNDRVQGWLFRSNHLAPTFSEAQVVKPPRFNAHYEIEDVKPVDGATWKLELAGLIADKRPWTAEQINALPQQEWIVRHICVEGWDYIGQWSGVNLRTFLERVGADLTAKYVAFKCADDYTESLDMASALHPQTLLCYAMNGQPLTPAHGAPLRLVIPVKYGIKNIKRIGTIRFTNTRPADYWAEQGYDWYAGL
jgi:DMSO/TMAO reductase YedYZ molybdopterin-dependent catalytic subunit